MNEVEHSEGLAWPVAISAGRSLIYRLTFFFMPLFLIGLGRSGWEVGFLMSLFALTTLFLAMPFGLFNDRLESRKLAVAGFLSMTAFYVGLRSASGFIPLVLFFILGGLGASLTQISMESLVLKGAREGRRGRRFGIYSLITTLVFGAATVAGGCLLESLEFKVVFLISGFGCLALACLSPALGRSRTVLSPIAAYRQDLSGKGKKIFLLILFFFTFHWGAEVTSYSPFLRQSFGFSMTQTGLYMGSALAALAAASFVSGRFSDRLVSIRHVMSAGFILSGTAQILMVFPPPALSFCFRFIHELGDGIIMVLLFFWVSKVFHLDRVGGNFGVLVFVQLAGQATSSLIFGPVGAALGYSAPLWMSGIIILLCFFTLHRFRHVIFEGV